MKIKLFVLVIVILGSIATNAQTIKTPEYRQLIDVTRDIEIQQILLSSREKYLRQELQTKTEAHQSVKDFQTQINEQKARIIVLQKEKVALTGKPERRSLPSSDSHEILKIIATQNERIIDLLEILARKQ